MGAGNAGSSGGGGRTDAGPNRTTAYKAGVGNINEAGKKTASYKSDNDDSFRNRGAVKIKNSKFKTPTTMILTKPLQAGSKVTRDFYTDKVLGSKNFKGQSKTDFLTMSEADQEKQYKSYIDNRTSGRTDAYGNTLSGGNDNSNNNTPTVIKKNIGGSTIQTTAPTEAEVSQSETANADAAALKVKKRGRSMTMMSGSKGVTKTSPDYSLGKTSLLGRV